MILVANQIIFPLPLNFALWYHYAPHLSFCLIFFRSETGWGGCTLRNFPGPSCAMLHALPFSSVSFLCRAKQTLCYPMSFGPKWEGYRKVVETPFGGCSNWSLMLCPLQTRSLGYTASGQIYWDLHWKFINLCPKRESRFLTVNYYISQKNVVSMTRRGSYSCNAKEGSSCRLWEAVYYIHLSLKPLK